MSMRLKYLLMVFVALGACGETQDKLPKNNEESQPVTLRPDKLQSEIRRLERKRRELNQKLEIKFIALRKDVRLESESITRDNLQIGVHESAIARLTAELDIQKANKAASETQIANEPWESDRTSQWNKLDSKWQEFSQMLKDLKSINYESPSENQLRIVDRAIRFHRNEFEKRNKPLPDLLIRNAAQLPGEVERAIQVLEEAIKETSTHMGSLGRKADSLEQQLKDQKDALIAEIHSLESQIAKTGRDIDSLKSVSRSSKRNIDSLLTKFYDDSVDTALEIMEVQGKLIVAWGKRVRTRYDEVKRRPLELEKKYQQFLQLENDVFGYRDNGDWTAVQALLDTIAAQWDSLALLLDEADKKSSLYSNLYVGDAFLLHYELSQHAKYAAQIEVERYRRTFFGQIDLIRDYLRYYPEATIYLDGHADTLEFGNDFYGNVELSKNRVINIREHLDTSKAINQNIKVVTDWYSKHIHRRIIAGITENNRGSVSDRRVEMRVIRQYASDEEEPPEIKRFKLFRDSLRIEISVGQTKYFKRQEDGFWTDLSYSKFQNAPLVPIYYKREAYEALLQHEMFRIIADRKDSTEIAPECRLKDIISVELGSQLRTVIHVDERPYRVEISRDGAKAIKDVKDKVFREFLETKRAASQLGRAARK